MKHTVLASVTTLLLFVYGGGLALSIGGVMPLFMKDGMSDTTHGNHEHTASTHHCPFMADSDTLCPMSLIDHLTLVRGLFETPLGTLLIIASVAGIASLRPQVPLLVRHLYSALVAMWWRSRQQLGYHYQVRQHQEYFASGLLHSKYFQPFVY
jgi:hypothetical protein